MNELANIKETMTSLEIAEVTGKRHDAVLRDIRSLLEQGVNAHNFVEVEYKDKKGENRPMYQLTKKGCLILASGYNALLREKIINRWEELEKKEQSLLTPEQMFMQSAQLFYKQQYELKRIAQVQEEQNAKIKNVNDKIDTILEERDENGRKLLTAKLSDEKVPEPTLRAQVNQLARQYGSANNVSMQDVWHEVYQKLYYCYHISIKSYKKNKGETYLDIAERNKFLDKVFNIVSQLVRGDE